MSFFRNGRKIRCENSASRSFDERIQVWVACFVGKNRKSVYLVCFALCMQIS